MFKTLWLKVPEHESFFFWIPQQRGMGTFFLIIDVETVFGLSDFSGLGPRLRQQNSLGIQNFQMKRNY